MSDSRSIPDLVASLIRKATDADGSPPFSDGALVEYRTGERELVTIDEVAAALVKHDEAEFVVDPDARGRGTGTTLLETLLRGGATLFWAHGDHPAARALAKSHGLAAARELLHLAAPSTGSGTGAADSGTGAARTVPEAPNTVPEALEGITTTFFTVGHDEAEWVALNALIFANHPEQGGLTITDLDELERESWFRADTFLLLRDGERMIGYCWLKLVDDRGEFYVVGVHPDYQGRHLGSILFDAGLARLAELGIHNSHLYVEGDNEPALRLYRSRGFSTESIDIQYTA